MLSRNQVLTWVFSGTVAILGLAGAGNAHAVSVLSLIQGGPNSGSDESREYLIDRDGGPTGRLDVGDSLRGIFDINTLNSGGANVGGATGNDELNAVFQVMVIGKTSLGGGVFQFNFGPDPAFEASICGGVAGCASAFVPGTGAMAAFFTGGPSIGGSVDFAADFTDAGAPAGPDDGTPGQMVPPSSADVSTAFTVTEEAFVALSRNDSHFWTLGYGAGVDAVSPGPDGVFGTPDDIAGADGSTDGLVGQGWVAITLPNVGDNILGAFSFSSGTVGGSFNTALVRLANNAGVADTVMLLSTTPNPFSALLPGTEFAASGSLKGVADLDTPWEIGDNVNFSFTAVPEPASILLLGFGLLALGFVGRRRRDA